MIFELTQTNSIAGQFISELRDIDIQKDRMRFRKNLERIGSLLAYELSKNLQYEKKITTTPLGQSTENVLIQQPVLVSILRAAMPFFQGFLNVFDKADCGMVGAYRVNSGTNVDVALDYKAIPPIEGKELILVDPMLATGKSMVKTVAALQEHAGTARKIHIVAAIAAPEGIEFVTENLDSDCSLWIGNIDKELNSKAYIIPGLGDAGDLCYGIKL